MHKQEHSVRMTQGPVRTMTEQDVVIHETHNSSALSGTPPPPGPLPSPRVFLLRCSMNGNVRLDVLAGCHMGSVTPMPQLG